MPQRKRGNSLPVEVGTVASWEGYDRVLVDVPVTGTVADVLSAMLKIAAAKRDGWKLAAASIILERRKRK